MKNTLNLCLAILFLVVLGCSCPATLAELGKQVDSSTPYPTPSANSTTSTTTNTTTSEGEYDLTMEKYNQLTIGMARSKVEEILGGKGTEISSSTGGGVRFSVNKWDGENFKSIILSFRNDKIMTRSQAGLK